MNQNESRRAFVKDSALATLALGLTAGLVEELRADPPAEAPAGPPVTCAVIGLGLQGREILNSLARLSNTPVAVVCDTYTAPGYLKRATDIAPKAAVVDDYKKVLDNKDVQAVFVATPSHLHRQIVLDALAAGKHVYCEAPLATNLDDARAIAVAGQNAKTVFQAGLQSRSNKQHVHVLNFMRAGVLGKTAGGRAQYHRKEDWRRAAPSPEREKELNWRLFRETSSGIPGEIGIHQFDTASWFLKALPVSITGFGGIQYWTQNGMEVPDTVQCVLEYPNNVRYVYDATLANSFDGSYEMFMGSDCAMLLRDQRAWMFKETDSPLLGWEVYARKDKLGVGDASTGTGIALVADATKLIAQGKQPGEVGTDVTKTALYQAIQSFVESINGGKKPVAGALEGYQATVIAHKAHEAVLTGSKIVIQPEWLALG